MTSVLLVNSLPSFTFSQSSQNAAKLFSHKSSFSNHPRNALGRVLLPVFASSTAKSIEPDVAPGRRSGNYPPTIWHNEYLQSITNVYAEESHSKQAEELKEDVDLMLKMEENHLELIDVLERLGLSYHFEDVIEEILRNMFNGTKEVEVVDLFTTSLEFRLLRQHGFRAPLDVFNKFRDEMGNFKASLSTDTRGLLALYEASYLSVEGEQVLDDARDFARKHLAENLKLGVDNFLDTMVRHALEIPIHWRMPRQESRWFIDVYGRTPHMNPILLQFAKLDFNIVQGIHQSDLKVVSRWWSSTGFVEHLSFGRDRAMENFVWSVGGIFEPKYGLCRVRSTKVMALATTMDDVYDVYGTLDELELFTDAIVRWDINSIEELPIYMKIFFLGLFNSVNEMVSGILKEQGLLVISKLKKSWADLATSYMKEARWYYSGYTPTLDEYLDNAWISVAAPATFVPLYYFSTNPITEPAMEYLDVYPSVVRQSSMIIRLIDDLGTAKFEAVRGDVPKSIDIYMKETGASEKEARSYVRKLIDAAWKELNESVLVDSPLPKSYIKSVVNSARMAEWMYQYGDAHGVTAPSNKDRVLALLIHPIS